MKTRTSESHPLGIDVVEISGRGRLGLTLCPGKRDAAAMTGPWARDLDRDLGVIRAWLASRSATQGSSPSHTGSSRTLAPVMPQQKAWSPWLPFR